MSDDEMSDGAELQEMIREYAAKEAENKKKTTTEKSDKLNSSTIAVKGKETLTKRTNEEWIKSEEEIRLEKLIFGDKIGFIKNLSKSVDKTEQLTSNVELSNTDGNPEQINERNVPKRKPAWTDDDDENILVGQIKRETVHTGSLDHLRMDKEYKKYLTKKFTRIVDQPKWADLDRKKSDADSDEEVLRTAGFLRNSEGHSLPAHDIQFEKLKDLNRATYGEGMITSIQFHPTSTAGLVCGDAGIATIYSIDGLKNEKLHSIRFDCFPIKCARILQCGTKAIFGSVRRHYYSYDLLTAKETKHFLPRNVTTLKSFEISQCGKWMAVAGRFGELHLFDAKSKELVNSFKQEHPVAGIRFSADSKNIITSGVGPSVSIFDIRQQRLQHSFVDYGCITGRALAISANSRMLATGSMEGVVNVYDYDKVLVSPSPTPEKTILNLTTAISDVKFNHSSEILAMCSMEVPSGVKLVHFPSGTVFANFPNFMSKIGEIQTLEFSPSSGFLAMGSRSKNVPLFRLKHFNNY